MKKDKKKRKQEKENESESAGGPLKGKAYMKELRKLQSRLCILQEWVKHEGLRVIILFEGRDAAGKGGTIKALTERVSPRVFRLVALPAPSDREKSQMYMQRYLPHFPAAGHQPDARFETIAPERRVHGEGRKPSMSTRIRSAARTPQWAM